MVMPMSEKGVASRTMQMTKVFTRRKTDEEEAESGPQLARVLGLADLTMLGVGSTLGVGVYVLAGSVAKSDSGPAVTLSFLIAAIASAFAGLCYAEFAARVPKAGSAYVYSYVTVGELAAFVIGWNLILEYVIGTASVARGLSNYIDAMVDYKMSQSLTEAMPIGVSWLSEYPDFLSCGFVLVLSLLLAWGVKESSFLNNIFTVVNLCTVALVIIAGSFYINFHNWALSPSEIPAGVTGGVGGFMPFGFSGVMAGAAKCFYGFVGFDCVATTGEEAKNPKRDIPLSIIVSLIIIFIAYFGIASVLTLMWPYYLQDADAPLPYVFGQVGLPIVKYAVNIGAIFALCTSLLGAMFPLPRVLYAMSVDGLLFEFFRLIHPRSHTPMLATLASGVFAGIMAAIFNLEQLVDMMSIGTLLAYTIVAICVVVLRYRDPNPMTFEMPMTRKISSSTGPAIQESTMTGMKEIFNLQGIKYPSRSSEAVAHSALAIYIVFTVVLCALLVNLEDFLVEATAWAVVLVAAAASVLLLALLVMALQPQSPAKLSFKVPFVPVLPCVSILINLYLMAKLDSHTWIRFIVWLFVGMLIYVFYSIPNSVLGQRARAAERNLAATLTTQKDNTKI